MSSTSTRAGTISERDGAIAATTGDIFSRIHTLLDKPSFSHEDSARVNSLLKLAELQLPAGKAALRHVELAAIEQRHGLDAKTYQRAFSSYLKFGLNGISAEERAVLNRNFARVEDTGGELRALGFGTGSAGGFTVPQDFSDSILAVQKLADPVRSVAQIVNTPNGRDLPWPTVDDTANVGELLAENIQAAEQDVVFAQTVLKSFKFSSKLVLVSLEWLTDSITAAEPTLTRLLGTRIARAQNAFFTTGSGSGQPQGVVTASALGKTAAGAAAVTLDELIDLAASVDPIYRAQGRFMMNDSTLTLIGKLKEATTSGRLINLDERRLLGYPVVISNNMAAMGSSAKSILFGDFSQFIVRDCDMVVLRLSERFASVNQVAFLLFQRSDSRLLTTAAVKHFQNAA